mmetsp:Transcript_20419/g.70633  ORF Transcript_20419/g.70633 Transcript_20419/m.70633 type:complete len:475 (+) Transcript_20419:3-1427(+)
MRRAPRRRRAHRVRDERAALPNLPHPCRGNRLPHASRHATRSNNNEKRSHDGRAQVRAHAGAAAQRRARHLGLRHDVAARRRGDPRPRRLRRQRRRALVRRREARARRAPRGDPRGGSARAARRRRRRRRRGLERAAGRGAGRDLALGALAAVGVLPLPARRGRDGVVRFGKRSGRLRQVEGRGPRVRRRDARRAGRAVRRAAGGPGLVGALPLHRAVGEPHGPVAVARGRERRRVRGGLRRRARRVAEATAGRRHAGGAGAVRSDARQGGRGRGSRRRQRGVRAVYGFAPRGAPRRVGRGQDRALPREAPPDLRLRRSGEGRRRAHREPGVGRLPRGGARRGGLARAAGLGRLRLLRRALLGHALRALAHAERAARRARVDERPRRRQRRRELPPRARRPALAVGRALRRGLLLRAGAPPVPAHAESGAGLRHGAGEDGRRRRGRRHVAHGRQVGGGPSGAQVRRGVRGSWLC